MVQTPVQQLSEILSSVAGSSVLVLLQGHPDPDAIASALAHQRICLSFGVEATIAHVLPVSHRENRALIKVLGIELRQVSAASDLADFQYLSLVDAVACDGSIELPSTLQLLTVVDHHRSSVRPQARFVDVRTDYGSTCTMYAEYLQGGLSPLTGTVREDARVATALLFGIQTDTDDFSLASVVDFTAAAYLRGFADTDALRRIGRRMISADAMDVVGRALGNLTVARDFALAGVGHIAVGHRDAIAQAADYIVAREDLDTAIVFGIVGDRIDGSLRTNSPSVDPSALLESAFGTDSSGRPYGGGRADKGGFQIPLGVLAEGSDKAAVWRIAEEVVRMRLSKAIPELAKVFEKAKG